MTYLMDPDPAKDAEMIAEQYVGRRRNPDDTEGDLLEEMAQWLESLGHTDEPVRYCPDVDLHRGLYLAREVTWRLPSGVLRAELDSPRCCWCDRTKL